MKFYNLRFYFVKGLYMLKIKYILLVEDMNYYVVYVMFYIMLMKFLDMLNSCGK